MYNIYMKRFFYQLELFLTLAALLTCLALKEYLFTGLPTFYSYIIILVFVPVILLLVYYMPNKIPKIDYTAYNIQQPYFIKLQKELAKYKDLKHGLRINVRHSDFNFFYLDINKCDKTLLIFCIEQAKPGKLSLSVNYYNMNEIVCKYKALNGFTTILKANSPDSIVELLTLILLPMAAWALELYYDKQNNTIDRTEWQEFKTILDSIQNSLDAAK